MNLVEALPEDDALASDQRLEELPWLEARVAQVLHGVFQTKIHELVIADDSSDDSPVPVQTDEHLLSEVLLEIWTVALLWQRLVFLGLGLAWHRPGSVFY